MARGPELPSVRQLGEIAADFGLDLTDDELGLQRDAMRGALASLRRIDDLTEERPRVKYPRTPGYRPEPEDNPYNAWYWRTDIEGASEGILAGFDIGVKDVVSVAGVPMMNGARVIEGLVPTVDATIVTRILDAGGRIVGKTACSDFSFSGGGHTSGYGPVRNPRKPSHAPGGSSKGSGAALAAGDVPMAIGGDQGGSIRIPASWCGVVGHKATYGLVPYTGCMMIEMTLDHIGPMAGTVENVARLLTAIAGPDPLDPRQRGVIPEDYVRDYMPAIGAGCEGLRVGVLREGFGQTDESFGALALPGSDPAVDAKVEAAVQRLEAAGAKVADVSVPMHFDGLAIWFAVAAEGATEFMIKGYGAGTNWSGYYDVPQIEHMAKSYRTRPNDLPLTVKNVLLLGEYLKRNYFGRYYAKAQNLKGKLTRAYDAVLDSVDVLVLPTIPHLPGEIPGYDADFGEYMFRALNMLNNTPQFNLTGHPAISVPCGASDDLPVGFQVVGRHFDDLTVLRVADAVEKSGDWRSL